MLSIVLIFTLSLTSHVFLNSNFRSRYSILFQCSSGPPEGQFCYIAKILASNKSALCRIDRFQSRDQELCKLLGIKESFSIWKEFSSHRIFFVHKHGRRFIVLYTNMATVTSCENDLLPALHSVSLYSSLRNKLTKWLDKFACINYAQRIQPFTLAQLNYR